jgi:PGF-CTERM protein
MNLRATVLTALLVTSVLGAAAAPAATQQAEGEAYSGTFVQFETGNAAVTNYAVDGSVVVDSVRAQSASETEGGIGVDAGASSSTSISGSAVSTRSQGDASASVAFESGTDMEAHDNQRGVVTFTASDGDQVVQANVSGDASSEGDKRVVVQGDDGAQGTFIVVGDGNVTTNADGQVTARVEEDSQLVYRQYNDERSDSEKTQEEMIQNGKATAEVYVYGAAESGGDSAEDGEENAESVVTYGQDTNAEVTERSRDRVNVTVDRTESQGKVLITTVSESAVENAESLEVYVDGEAAAQADSYSDVRAATEGADRSRYMVRQSGSAEAAVDVIVGINQFSERTVSMQSAGDGGEPTATDGDDTMGGDDTDGGDGTDGDGAGFGVLAALVALAAALIAVRKRS